MDAQLPHAEPAASPQVQQEAAVEDVAVRESLKVDANPHAASSSGGRSNSIPDDPQQVQAKPKPKRRPRGKNFSQSKCAVAACKGTVCSRVSPEVFTHKFGATEKEEQLCRRHYTAARRAFK